MLLDLRLLYEGAAAPVAVYYPPPTAVPFSGILAATAVLAVGVPVASPNAQSLALATALAALGPVAQGKPSAGAVPLSGVIAAQGVLAVGLPKGEVGSSGRAQPVAIPQAAAVGV